MEVVQYREDESADDIIKAVLADADNAMLVDCASMDVKFVVNGWFIFPKGSMTSKPDILNAT